MLRTLAARPAHLLLGLLRRAGIAAWPLRDSRLGLAGLRLVWRDDDPACLRGTIYEHRIDGNDVRFFVTNENDWLQADHALGRWYEPRELALVEAAWRGGTFVDVGAGLGNHSLYAGLVLGAERIVAFEPVPATRRICRINLLLNGLDSRTVLHGFGLSDSPGTASVALRDPRNIGATALARDGAGSIPLRRGDEALAGETVGFVKIDVEGMELAVLRGLAGIVSEQAPAILVEVDRANRAGLEDWLETASYRIDAVIERSTNANLLLLPRG